MLRVLQIPGHRFQIPRDMNALLYSTGSIVGAVKRGLRVQSRSVRSLLGKRCVRPGHPYGMARPKSTPAREAAKIRRDRTVLETAFERLGVDEIETWNGVEQPSREHP